MAYSGLILFGTLISSGSQVMLKKAALKSYDSPMKEYLNPLVIGAYCLFFAATFCTVFAYQVVPLSMGPVLEASGYVFVTVFGITVFKERISKRKLAALTAIISGIMIYSFLG